MGFWFIFTLIAVLIWIVSLFIKNRVHLRIVSYLYVLYIWFIAAFRFQIGTDYDVYMQFYNSNYLNNPYLMLMEPTFGFLVTYLNEIGFSSQMLFLIYETIIIAFFYAGVRFFVNNERQIMLILLIYTFFPRGYWNSMNQIRQSVAICMILFSVRYIIEGEKIKYILGVIGATLFHYSAILFLPLCFWRYIHLNVFKSVCLFVSMLLCRIVDLPQRIINVSVSFVLGGDSKYNNYFINYIEDGSFPGFGIFIIVVYFLFLFTNKEIKNEYKFLINMVAIGICVICFFPGSTPLARYRDYFVIFYIIFTGNYINELSEKFNSFIPYLFTLVMAIYFLYSIDHMTVLHESSITGLSGNNINYEFNFDLIK